MLLVSLQFLTPKGALLALLVLVPLGAFLAVSKRATGVREALGVPALPESARLVPLVAVVAVGVLLGLAAAQPLVERTSDRKVRSDAEAYVVHALSLALSAVASRPVTQTAMSGDDTAERYERELFRMARAALFVPQKRPSTKSSRR